MSDYDLWNIVMSLLYTEAKVHTIPYVCHVVAHSFLVFSSKFSLKKKSGKRQQKLPLSHKYTAYFDSVGLELHFTGVEGCLRFLHQSQSEVKQNQSNPGIEICSRITRKHLRKITKYHATLPSNMSLSFPLSHYHSRLFCSSRIHGVRASLSHNRTVPL